MIDAQPEGRHVARHRLRRECEGEEMVGRAPAGAPDHIHRKMVSPSGVFSGGAACL